MFCSHDAGGGSGACGIFRRCRLRFGKRDLASSFFPCEFFNAPVALGLSSVDFWPVTSPLRRPTAVPCLIHWMIVGVSFVQGKEEVGVCFLVRWECFVETWSSSRSFAKTFHSSFLGVRGKCLWPCVFPVVTVLRLNDFSVFGLRRLNAVPCIHYWKDVWCRMFCSHDAGGGSGACGIFRWCRLRFGRRDLASSFFPCEFFNAPVALGLSSVDFWPVTSPLRRPTAVACLIHWMIVGASFVQGKEEVGFLPAGCAFGLVWVAFSVCGQKRRSRRVSFQ
jgi:hypothetical protein